VRLADPRRLLGRNVLLSSPSGGADAKVGVTMELCFEPGEGERDLDVAEARLRSHLAALTHAVGLPPTPLVVHRHKTGATVALAADIDSLRTAIDVLEWAGVQSGLVPTEEVAAVDVDELARRLAAERSPTLGALLAEARKRDVPTLLFDDGLSLGQGAKSLTFALDALPEAAQVPWESLGRIPVALVTGTNGKTTTTRFLAAMMRAAGVVVGSTSTDGVVIGIERTALGDWSGPGGARVVLRDARVQMAVLETARGGLLRRGLAADGVDVAIVTNVSEDHLGDYGIHDVDAMADVKMLVAHGVRSSGHAVLNAVDPRLVARAKTLAAPVIFFARDVEHPVVAAHLAQGGWACVVEKGVITLADQRTRVAVLPVADVPLAFGGDAVHNVENALAATAAAQALGLRVSAMQAGLRALRPDVQDAHGRSLVYVHDGVTLLVDFAHNPAGVTAALAFVQRLRRRSSHAGRLFVLTGAAGDRSASELQGVSAAIAAVRPDRVIVRELDSYRRGKERGLVPTQLAAHLVDCGLEKDAIGFAADDVTGLALALDEARPGDVVAMLVHVDGPGVAALLAQRGFPLLDH
jgi:cyanophycin synthetase